jgi:hypothetical protein
LSAVEHKGEQSDAFAEILKLIDGTSRGLPDQSKIPADRDMIDVTPTLAPEPRAPNEALPVPLEAVPRRPH